MAEDVKTVPEGMQTVAPHLVVEDAASAIEFYKRAFGAVELGRHPMPDGKRLMHAAIRIGNSTVFLVDAIPEFELKGPKVLGGSPVTIHLSVEDADAVAAKAAAAGATITMPVEEAFWGDRYGKLVDPFGHHWSVSTHVRDVSPEEMAKAGEASMPAKD